MLSQFVLMHNLCIGVGFPVRAECLIYHVSYFLNVSTIFLEANTFNHSSGHFPILLAMYCRTI